MHTQRYITCLFAAALTLGMGLTLTSGCATTRTLEQQRSDTAISVDLANRYATDMEIDRFRIDIDTINGEVTLRGVVTDAVQAKEAERIAYWTEGVVGVDNQLQIDPEGRDAMEGFEDGWIELVIDAKLTGDSQVKSRNVDVDVIEGVVTLSGIVEDYRARVKAEDVAKTVDGVVDVVNELQVDES